VTDLLSVGKAVLGQVQRAAGAAPAEVFLLESESRSSDWSEQKPENRVAAQSRGLGLRLIREGCLGFGYTNRWDPDAVDRLVRQAIASSQSTAPDPLLDVPNPVALTSGKELDLVDPTLTDTPWEPRTRFLEGLEGEVKKREMRISKVLRGSYREGRAQIAVVNSRGVAAVSEGTSASFSLACVVAEGGETQIGYAFQGVRHHQDLKPDWVINRAIEHTMSLLGAKQIPSGRYDLVLDPFVAAEMLELLAGALQADRVQKGKSFLATKVGQAIAASCLTLVDNGRLPRGLATGAFDAEGMPTQKTVLIEKGRLNGFLFDSYTARKGKTQSTGNAGRASYKGLPEPEASNFYLEAGTSAPEAILKGVKSGIYVRSVMGLHTVDTISGDYSLGLMGERIENGVRSHAVRGVTMAGNLLDLFKNVAAAGSDLIFSGSVGSPTLWIKDVSVGGI
jgi:PmbA protein